MDDPLLLEIDALLSQLKEDAANGMLEQYKDWQQDIERAENIYLEDPGKLDIHFDRIRVMMLPKEKKLLRVIEKSAELVKQQIVAVPPETWKIPNPSADPEVSQNSHAI